VIGEDGKLWTTVAWLVESRPRLKTRLDYSENQGTFLDIVGANDHA
jgi:hypothetical protein